MMGIINLLKPPGISSFDCVKRVRDGTGVKKVGHTGTLDPLACGVLPLCLGRATKLVPFFIGEDKVYRGEMTLGLETTTLDLEGAVTAQNDVQVKTEEILDVFSSFVGRQMQLPPLYSARSYQGKRYYQLVREGRSVERRPSEITVYYLKFLHRTARQVLFETKVSKGTYIRSLVDDIGHALGCGACLSFLLRTQVGSFSIETTSTLEEVDTALQENKRDSIILPPDAGLLDLPAVHMKGNQIKKVKNGVPLLSHDVVDWPHGETGELVRIYGGNRFFAIYRIEEKTLVARRVFL